jgi:hypothetical protein
MQLDVCGKGVATDYNTLMKTLWSDVPGHQEYTLQSMFESCSHRLANFSQRSGSKVLNVTIPIPCDGTTPSGKKYFHGGCSPIGTQSWVAYKVYLRCFTLDACVLHMLELSHKVHSTMSLR